MTALYDVFVRDWWKEHPKYPGRFEPNPGADKEYIARGLTRDAAQTTAKEYNASHDPGRLSRKAEFENDGSETEYSGYPNYATWNVALWYDNDEHLYNARLNWIKYEVGLDEDDVVDASDVREFFLKIMGGTTADLDEHDVKQIDWAFLAEQWEEERAEMMD